MPATELTSGRSYTTNGDATVDAPPGSAQVQLVVSDVHAARVELVARGVEVGDVQDFPWGSFVFFSDPDGNRWAVQQLPRATDL